MKKSVLIHSILLLLIFFSGCNSKKLENHWIKQPVEVDGDFSDWEGIELQFSDDIDAGIASQNDAENFYLMFRFTDIQLLRKIQMMGITIWLNAEDKKDKVLGIQYTGSVDLHVMNRPDFDQSDRMQERIPRFRENMPGPGKIIIINNENRNEIVENNPVGPAAGSKSINGIYCYEFKIPLPTIVNLGDIVKLGIELGGMKMDDMLKRGGEMRPGAGMERPGGMGGGGRGRGGMRGGPPMGERSTRMGPKEIWLDVLLAMDDSN